MSSSKRTMTPASGDCFDFLPRTWTSGMPARMVLEARLRRRQLRQVGDRDKMGFDIVAGVNAATFVGVCLVLIRV